MYKSIIYIFTQFHVCAAVLWMMYDRRRGGEGADEAEYDEPQQERSTDARLQVRLLRHWTI